MAVPATLIQLSVGNRFGEAVTSAQGMKIAASEAQWNTCEPCGFSLFQIGGFSAQDPNPSFSITIPRLLSWMATGSFNGQVQGLNQLQAQEQKDFGPGNYMPRVRLMYWSMRVMAMLGVAMFLIAAVGAWLYRKRRLEKARWFLWTASSPSRSRSSRRPPAGSSPRWAASRGSCRTCSRPPTRSRRASARRRSRRSLGVFALLYVVLGVVDFVLMRRYARVDPPPLRRRRARQRYRRSATRSRAWISRTIWFVLIAVLWSGYFLLEGFDFGVGMLLPVLPRDERERSTMFESIGPVWDGNEVWLVVAGGATFAAFPAWYATMFSGFYLALLLILVLLIVRVVSFEWREQRDSPRWRATWLWANTVGSVGAAVPLGRGARQPRARRPARLRRATSPATSSTSSAPTRSSRASRSSPSSRSTARRT